jgi:hypothetical protein
MISTKQFLYNKQAKTFQAEVSELGNPFVRIFNDACDIGIVLISHLTMAESKWYVTRELFDNEGDLTSWFLKPTPETIRKMPALANHEMFIYND